MAVANEADLSYWGLFASDSSDLIYYMMLYYKYMNDHPCEHIYRALNVTPGWSLTMPPVLTNDCTILKLLLFSHERPWS